MTIGFTITNLNASRQEAIDYLVSKIYGLTVEEATNIVDSSYPVYTYGTDINKFELMYKPFSVDFVEATSDITLASIVDYTMEIPYVDLSGNPKILVFEPTGNNIVTRHTYNQVRRYVEIDKVLLAFSLLPIDPDTNVDDFLPADFATNDLL